ncbi:hypothetical protein [Calothrix sp. UHCC 0171]|uniref:hypothetical protein n=1 Tax=Calothrix sp. UHCC 0171 TaxID=3110245 RepID=UPI002B203CD0|nr:hypothetical protein [Calothrix sp. UHCC 0171]MEA5573774.1 hypothetical protein [Calothrix sp. UHCC 0171]
MMTEIYYLIRSKTDGKYLAARPNEQEKSYLLLFNEDFDAMSYLNTHAGDLANKLGVESISGSQISGLMKRWGFVGIGIVSDPLLPKIEFLQRS